MMIEWLPIETAPKDCTEIIVCGLSSFKEGKMGIELTKWENKIEERWEQINSKLRSWFRKILANLIFMKYMTHCFGCQCRKYRSTIMNNLTPEQLQKSREEFEAHYKTFGLRFERGEQGFYVYEHVQSMWSAWAARHKTICVELPAGDFYLSRDAITQLLQAAGIGVKS